MSNENYGQAAINRGILREEEAEREYASRQPGALEALAEEVERLQREVAGLRNRKPFDGAAFGKQMAEAVKAYVDPVFDDMCDRIDRILPHKRVLSDDLDDLHRKVNDLVDRLERLEKQSKAAKPVVRVPMKARPANGRSEPVQ